jgi:hypothetical protein
MDNKKVLVESGCSNWKTDVSCVTKRQRQPSMIFRDLLEYFQ